MTGLARGDGGSMSFKDFIVGLGGEPAVALQYPVGERGKLVGTVMSAGRERRVVREPRLAAQGQGFAGAGAQQEGPPIFLGWDWGPRARKPEPSRIDT